MIDKRALAMMLSVALVLSMSAAAQSMSRDKYDSTSYRITSDFTAEFGACGFFIDNAREICRVEATGRRWVAQAALDAQFKQSAGARYRLQVARIDADYAVARQRCADNSGRERALCTDEARAHDVSARANARIQSKAAEAGK